MQPGSTTLVLLSYNEREALEKLLAIHPSSAMAACYHCARCGGPLGSVRTSLMRWLVPNGRFHTDPTVHISARLAPWRRVWTEMIRTPIVSSRTGWGCV